MSKFNSRQTGLTTNREGFPAYAMEDGAKLVSQVLTSFFNEQKFYGDNSAEIRKYPLTSRTAILQTCMRDAAAGGGTQMGLPFEVMLQEGIRADRVIIISDNECNDTGLWHRGQVQALADEYRRQSGNDIWVHAIDLMGYATGLYRMEPAHGALNASRKVQ